MAAVSVPVTEIVRTGVAPATAVTGDTVNGHAITNDGNMYLSVANSTGTPGTVTIAVAKTVDGLAVASRAVTIPANATEHRIGPFPTSTYGNSLGVTVSATTLSLRAYHFSSSN